MDIKIRELAMHDATVRASLMIYEARNDVTYETALEGMVLALANEKKAYFDEVVKLKMRIPPENMIDLEG